MSFHFFSKYLKRYGLHRLRRIMRGYRFLKESKSLNLIANVNRALTTHKLNIKERHFSRYIFGEGIGKAELICRQYLLTRVADRNLNRALLHTLGKPGSTVVYYLPPEWRKIIRDQRFKVAPFRTALLWETFVGMMMAYGVLKIARIILNGIKAVSKQSTQRFGRYIYFDGLAVGNLPQPYRDGRSHDIISWYMQWDGRVSNIDTLCHGVIDKERRAVNGTPVIPVLNPILPFTHLSSLVRYIAWCMGAILVATWGLLRGRWWHALLLNQAAYAAQVRMVNPEQLAKDYLFHNSSWIYRPLWTYEAERRGARITFYFYSTNCEAFKRKEGYTPLPYGWQAMSWPYYLVWDEYQADFVRRAVGKTVNISVVRQIWFYTTNAAAIPEFRGRGVAVFDITPTRSSRYCTLGADFEFYIPEICIPFLQDIQQVTENAGYMMLWKRKRKLKNKLFAHPLYLSFAEHLSERENVIEIDPDISAYQVIETSMIVISMPFTSTALIARELGKPSCYYDPSGLIQKDDRAAHGIPIIRGPEELVCWFSTIRLEPQILKNTGL